MNVKKEKLIASFSQTEQALTTFSLPLWETLPDLELYMDQVVSLVNKYLSVYENVTDLYRPVTSAMINNYVKLGIIPSPIKKKYSKIHLAYLLIVCTLKQTLDMSTIGQIIPVGLDEKEVCAIYDSFVRNQHTAFNYVFRQTRAVADPIFESDGENDDKMKDLVMQVSVSATIFKILTEKITRYTQDEK